MTGAPKRRTMQIIDELEGEARGVYSGAIGYLGLGGGCDLSVAIRTIVSDGEEARVGAGGAIVTQSDAGDEYEEMLLKASAPMRAIDPGVDGRRSARRDRLQPDQVRGVDLPGDAAEVDRQRRRGDNRAVVDPGVRGDDRRQVGWIAGPRRARPSAGRTRRSSGTKGSW